jgi:Domain of unknown function (DUF5122) beta-propeller
MERLFRIVATTLRESVSAFKKFATPKFAQSIRWTRVRCGAAALVTAALACVGIVNAQVDPVPGSYDASFALGNGKVPSIPIDGIDLAYGSALQPDGKLIIVGVCGNTTYSSCIARILANGSMDPDFDGPAGNADGKFRLQLLSSAYAVAVQPDGKIVLAGGMLR